MSIDEANDPEANERQPNAGEPDRGDPDHGAVGHGTPGLGAPGHSGAADGADGRPKFDDVASLFGNIVPPPGTPVRSLPASRRLPTLSDPSSPAILVTPPRRTAPDATQDHRFARALNDRPERAFAPELRAPPAADPAVGRSVAEPALPKVERTEPRPLPFHLDDRLEAPRVAKFKGSAANVPWPDAFEPTRNFRRKPASQYWAWLLLVPLLAVAAIGLFMVDPQTIRTFVDTHFPHLQHPATDTVTSLLPAPFRTDTPSTAGAAAPAGAATPAVTPAVTQGATQGAAPAEPAPAPASGSAAESPAVSSGPATSDAPAASPSPNTTEPILVPAAPTVTPTAPFAATPSTGAAADIAPAGTAPSDTGPTASGPADTAPTASALPPVAPSVSPPADTAVVPVPPAASPSGIAHITVHYRRAIPAGEAEAHRVVAQAEKMAGTVDLRLGSGNYRSPTVVYYTPLDRDAATGLARALGDGWSVRAGPGRASQGAIDLWLP